LFVFGRFRRSPDVEHEAVFAQPWQLGGINRTGSIWSLPAGSAVLFGVTLAFPGCRGLRCFPAQIAYRWRCIGNSAKRTHVRRLADGANQQALFDANRILARFFAFS